MTTRPTTLNEIRMAFREDLPTSIMMGLIESYGAACTASGVKQERDRCVSITHDRYLAAKAYPYDTYQEGAMDALDSVQQAVEGGVSHFTYQHQLQQRRAE